MKRFMADVAAILGFVLAAICFVELPSTVRAAFIATGNVSPANPATWTSSTNGYIGNTSDGNLTVNLNSHLYSWYGCIGNASGVSGGVTIDGAARPGPLVPRFLSANRATARSTSRQAKALATSTAT